MSNASPPRHRRSRAASKSKGKRPAAESRTALKSPDTTPNEREPVEQVLRLLARRHCRSVVRALAAVVKDRRTPASARITAATTLVSLALGRESGDGFGKGQGLGKSLGMEQVVRLAWMETKGMTRERAKGPKPGTSKGKGVKTAP